MSYCVGVLTALQKHLERETDKCFYDGIGEIGPVLRSLQKVDNALKDKLSQLYLLRSQRQ